MGKVHEEKTGSLAEEYAGLETMVEKYSDLLFRTAYFQCRNRCDAEDIVQEAFLRYMKKKPVFKDQEHEKAWFLRTTINLAKDYVKSFWNSKTQELDHEISYCDESGHELMAMIEQLPQKYRLVIQLHYMEGYSLKEVSVLLGRKVSTVGTWLDRARKMIQEWREQNG